LISRIGRGASSQTRLSTAMGLGARKGGRPVHIAYSAEAGTQGYCCLTNFQLRP
jgi:hypothetical protein